MNVSTTASTAVPFVSALSGALTKHLQQQPGRIAIGTSDLQTTITYGQLDTLVRSAMAQISRIGLKRGHTIALLSDNSVEFVVGLLALIFSGARVAPVNPALTSNELTTRLAQLPATALLVTRHLANRPGFGKSIPPGLGYWIMELEGSGSSAEVRIVHKEGTPAPGASAQPDRPAEGDEIALLMFTGGTTGAPKLVPLTHRNIAASIEHIASGYGLSPDDATLLVMPLFHGHGLIGGLLSTLASGGRAYVPSTGEFSAHMFWPDVVRLGVTWYTAVPTIHRILLNRAPQEYPKSSAVPLRFIRSCSAPLDEELAAATAATFHAPMIGAYGMTESCHQLASNPLPVNGPNKPLSVGLPTGVEIRIAGDGGREVPSGGVGEVWVRGATVASGYVNNPEATAASFVDGWYRSGDLGSIDEDGYIFLRGRLKELINRGGEKIAPGDIDAVLLSHPKVLEAASFGEADTMYGERVEAAVILRPGREATERELQEYCRTRLGAFEVPQRIHIVAKFPRTAKGTADRRALARQFAV